MATFSQLGQSMITLETLERVASMRLLNMPLVRQKTFFLRLQPRCWTATGGFRLLAFTQRCTFAGAIKYVVKADLLLT